MFRIPSHRNGAIFAFGFTFSNLFTGIDVLTNYAVKIYEQVGLTGYMPLLINGVFVLITFPLNFLT